MMRYLSLYIEVVSDVSDNELRSAVTGTLAGAALKARDGSHLGRVVHVQVTAGPKDVRTPSHLPEEGDHA